MLNLCKKYVKFEIISSYIDGLCCGQLRCLLWRKIWRNKNANLADFLTAKKSSSFFGFFCEKFGPKIPLILAGNFRFEGCGFLKTSLSFIGLMRLWGADEMMLFIFCLDLLKSVYYLWIVEWCRIDVLKGIL